MLAQGVVCAQNLGTVADGEVLFEKPNQDPASIRRSSKWKRAFDSMVWALSLPMNLRSVLLVILRHCDPLGRLWWGQSSLAGKIGCTARNLRRLLPQLIERGFLRVEQMTFTSLTQEQRELGLPLPARNDRGRAPNLLTLLVDGEPACEVDKPPPISMSASPATADERQDKPHPDDVQGAVDGHFVQVLSRGTPGQNGSKYPRTKCPTIS